MSGNSPSTGILTLRRDVKFNGVKVFSATMVAENTFTPLNLTSRRSVKIPVDGEFPDMLVRP